MKTAIDNAIEFFDREFVYDGTGHLILNKVFDDLISNFFEHIQFALHSLNRARDILDKYELMVSEAFELKNHHIRQAHFDVIVSELNLIKSFVKGVYIPK